MGASYAQSRDWSGLRRRLSELLCAQGLSLKDKTEGYALLRQVENEELAERLCQGSLHSCCFDAADLARNLWQAAKEVCSFSSAGLFFGNAPPPLPVNADQAAFINVLLHLFCNCFLYAGHSPLVKFSVSQASGSALFLLQDLGPGIPPFMYGSLFKPGSGLWLARSFAKHSGGVFLLSSSPGKGVKVLLSLPLCKACPLSAAPTAQQLLQNAFGPLFVQLSPRCVLPDL